MTAQRLVTRLRELAALTGARVDRPGWSAAETRAHELVGRWATARGLVVGHDRAGSLVAARPGDAAPVWLGSHLDTVPGGGAFDGALGVLAAVDVAAAVPGAAAVAFRDEEGWRFGRGSTGAATACGRLEVAARQVRDAAGTTLDDAMRAVLGRPATAVELPAAFLELHCEQGTRLAEVGHPVGLVLGAVGRVRLRIAIHGAPAHAGTTPLARRADAACCAARLVLAVRDLARGRTAVIATVGVVETPGGAGNVVAGRARLAIDLRGDDPRALAALEDGVRAAAAAIGAAEGCRADIETLDRADVLPFAGDVIDVLSTALDPGAPALWSWAGHDAAELHAAGVASGMLFVRCANDGAAHAPDEWCEPADVAAGTAALRRAAAALIGRPRAGWAHEFA